MKISVALAAYKGEKFIAEQINSILSQLGENDEIIVSDDYPQGLTKGIVAEIAAKDKRIRYIKGEGKGVIRNFENALSQCSGDVIFLCDQDDVWLPCKVKDVIREFENGADLVLHDASVTDADLAITEPSYFSVHGASDSLAKNLLKNTFVGCCMAFTKEVLQNSLPFPKEIAMHDWWIALAAIKKGHKVSLLKKPLILWRRHGNNVTGHKTSAVQKINWRIKMLLSLARI